MLDRAHLENGTLYVTPRSPFARRVRLAFLENGISYQEVMLDLMGNPHLEYFRVNPVKKVPAWELASGETLIDSNQILNVLYRSIESPLATRGNELIESAYWTGLAVGLCERLVEYFFEGLRPAAQRDAELLEEIHTAISEALSRLETHLQANSRETLLAGGLRQVDLDMGAALDYLALRYSGDWKRQYPLSSEYLDYLSIRPSFLKTQPPAV
jgi:glutathione S-transferase